MGTMYAFGKMMRKLIAKHGTKQAEISRATGIKKQNLLLCVDFARTAL